MVKKEIKLNSEKVNKRERKIKTLKLGLLMSALFLMIIYVILRIIYEQGGFTVSLDQNFAKKSGIVMYENPETKENRRILKAEKKEYLDNISVNWLPNDLDNYSGGAHNGDNYIAYTFYIENQGADTINYWYTIFVDDVIRNVDKAVRVMVYQNGERTIYAKLSSNGEPEKDTEAFYSDDIVVVKGRKDFKEGETDKFTIVIYLEGDDPDCIDDLIGGQMTMHMEITEEQLGEQEIKNNIQNNTTE